jgi:hypothetical protein
MRHEKHPWFAPPAGERPPVGEQPAQKKPGFSLPPKTGKFKKLAKGGKMIAPHR